MLEHILLVIAALLVEEEKVTTGYHDTYIELNIASLGICFFYHWSPSKESEQEPLAF